MRLVLALLAATCLASAVFVGWPAIDLGMARLFYDGTGFPVEADRLVETTRMALYAAEDAGFLATLVLTLRRRPFLHLAPRAWLFLMLVFLTGPGVLVNGLLKPVWNRARPFQTLDFGGKAQFTPAWSIGHDCCHFRSFVSGEMAGATALAVCLILILRANRTNLGPIRYGAGLALTAAVPLFTAWQRIAAGRHFLSDVVLAMLLTLLAAAALYRMTGRAAHSQALLTSQPIPPISRLP
ncbi:MAG: hypothetical protein B7Y02_04815 [Rhodobacterales bacterium 17-64-5]|nr:MAG: hypothetical protein B7Y02_04815 [Rhodobacterales bacterium 17-64-5]